MEPNTRPLQDGTPAEPTPDPAAVWQEILADLEDRYPGISGPISPAGMRNLCIIHSITDAMAGRRGLPTPEPGGRSVMSAVILPGRPEAAAGAREFARKALAGYPGADDAVLCLDELVVNAVQHSRSGLPGGTLGVRLTVTAASVLAEVVDEGPLGVPFAASRDTLLERGRGLVLVEALTRAWGSAGNGVWWFWLPLGGDPE